ncbi:MAG TPA: chemotaxis protein CheW [Gemmatimonadaceae bacterium]|nr:chemotaxis protein CheW [Gemmatimonadaceae bacterium]
MKKPRISYREWLHRDAPLPDAPGAPADALPPPADSAADIAPAPDAAPPAGLAPAAERAPEEIPAPAAAPESQLPARPKAEPEAPATAPAEYLVFRVGRERFAVPLDTVDEAIDLDEVQRIPEMRGAMLGVLTRRGASVPVYAPAGPLGVAADTHRAALIFQRPRGALALAVDDVDDVVELTPEAIRRAPLDFGDGVLVGVARRGPDFVGVLDAGALIAACRAEPVLETA